VSRKEEKMILGYTYKQLKKRFKDLDVNDYTRSYRRPYKTAADWLKKISFKNEVNTSIIEGNIKYIESEIKGLQKDLVVLHKQLEQTCNHPIDKLQHSGFATSCNDRFSEIVECDVCNKRWRRNTTKIPKRFYVDI
jgi:hypothetical protein